MRPPRTPEVGRYNIVEPPTREALAAKIGTLIGDNWILPLDVVPAHADPALEAAQRLYVRIDDILPNYGATGAGMLIYGRLATLSEQDGEAAYNIGNERVTINTGDTTGDQAVLLRGTGEPYLRLVPQIQSSANA